MNGLLLRDVELYGAGRGDCRIRGDLIVETGRRLRPLSDERVVPGDGGALVPGLADHHLHLTALAASRASLDASTLSREQLAVALATATPGADGWIRVVGYDDVAHGDADRCVLDAGNREAPVRMQHRSGALWVVNSAGLTRLHAEEADHPGIEREAGAPTGRLWRADRWLRDILGGPPPSLRQVGAQLTALGITHVSDATPDPEAAQVVMRAVETGELPQRVMLMASPLSRPQHPRLSIGPVKLIVTDHALPDLDDFTDRIRSAHTAGRPVAVHCVTRVALAFTLAALDSAGVREGDRIEHCAVADGAAARELAARRLVVVTQPTLVALRGDDYWQRSDLPDRPDLWRYASLLEAGVAVAPSSDAPYGDPDPWRCLRDATDRRTASGRVLGARERVDAATTLRGMVTTLHDPTTARAVAPGHVADLVVLDRPLSEALSKPDAKYVRATIIAGEFRYGDPG